MKYYSEKTKKLYDSEEDLEKSEASYAAKELELAKTKEARASRAKEVEDAYKAYTEAGDKYMKLRNQFVKDYGSYHATYNSVWVNPKSLFDIFFN